MSDRKDMELIAELVPAGSRVLDLGCGNGELLAHLRDHRQCSGYGIEIDDANVLACEQRGVNVVQLNLEEGLALFEDRSFDVVLQLDTLQHLRNTEKMLSETARVGRIGIVSFPNLRTGRNRLHVVGGRMPLTRVLPYEWYDTPNIRSAPTLISKCWHGATACASSIRSGSRRAQWCGAGRICWRALRCSSSSAVDRRCGGLRSRPSRRIRGCGSRAR